MISPLSVIQIIADRDAQIAQLVEQRTENPRVVGSIPTGGTNAQCALRVSCGRSSSGRAPPCQGGGSEFEPRRPLQRAGAVMLLFPYGDIAKW